MSLCYKHSLTSILLSALNILLLNELIEQFLNGCNANTCKLFHIGQSQYRLRAHGIQYLRIIWRTESYPFAIVPPYIFIYLKNLAIVCVLAVK